MGKIKIGAVTIGQAPRTDITDDIRPMLASNIELSEYGALDPYSYEEACERFAPSGEGAVLVSRMRDGRQVTMSEKAVIPLVQDCIARAEQDGVDATELLCTGRFPKLIHRKLLILPQSIIHSLVQKLTLGQSIGLFVPDRAQIAQVKEWFHESQIPFVPVIASPYQEAHLMGERAQALNGQNLSCVLLDCMGYGCQMKKDIQQACGLPVILPRTFIARLLNEMFEQ